MSEKILKGRYKIANVLGSGGFGKTYLAEDLDLPGHPPCVVKLLQPQTTDPDFLATAKRMFEKEAEVLAKLGSHPQIPQLLAHFEQGGKFFLVQEFIDGNCLNRELQPGDRWSETATLDLLQDLLETLTFVHQQNVIHRDIKPANLIRRRADNKIVLIDFGAVKEITNLVTSPSGQSSLTVAIGTPGYMPNEQLSGKPRFSSDIYAVGMLGIQALTGGVPGDFPEDHNTAELLWHDRLAPQSYRPELIRILDKMVRYDFRQRYQSAAEALRELQALNLVKEPQTDATQAIARPRNRQTAPTSLPTTVRQQPARRFPQGIFLGGAALTGAAIAAIGLFATRQGIPTPPELAQVTKPIVSQPAIPQPPIPQPVATIAATPSPSVSAPSPAAIAPPSIAPLAVSAPKPPQPQLPVKPAVPDKPRPIAALPSPKPLPSLQPAVSIPTHTPESERSTDDPPFAPGTSEATPPLPNADNIKVLLAKGIELGKTGQVAEAIDVFDRILERDPALPEAWVAKGMALARLGRNEEAIAALDRAIQLRPGMRFAVQRRDFLRLKLQNPSQEEFKRVPANHRKLPFRGEG